MIYGWGTDHKTSQLDESTVAVCRFRYVSLAFIFSFVWKRQWFLQGRDRALDREVTADEINSIYGPGSAPTPGLWRRYGVLFTGGALLAYLVVGSTVQTVFGDGELVAADSLAVAQPADNALASAAVDGPQDEVEPAAPATAAVEERTADATQAPSPADGEDDGLDAEGIASTDVGTTPAGVDGFATRIELVGDNNIMSTDVANPADEDLAELTVDGIHTTSQTFYAAGIAQNYRSGDVIAEEGNKLVVVDIQMLVTSQFGNINEGAFRIVDPEAGVIYSHSVAYHTSDLWAGTLFNERLVFEVPASLMAFEFQAGSMDSQRDGLQVKYEVELEAGDIGPYAYVDKPFNEGPVSAELLSDDNIGSPSIGPGADTDWLASIEILSVEVAGKVGPEAPLPGHKWLVVDTQIVGASTFARLANESIHVLADGEWYPTPEQINESVGGGKVWSGPLVFQIPAEVEEAVLKMGPFAHWAEGDRVEYRLELP